MNYSVRDAEKLLDKGVSNLSSEEITIVLGAFFKEKAEQPNPSKSLETTSNKLIIESADCLQKVDSDLLKRLDSYNAKNAARIVNIIKRFRHSEQKERSDFGVLEEIPSNGDALRLYFLAREFAEKRTNVKPWEYQRFLGEGGFGLLESYLIERGLISSITSAKEAEKTLCGSM